MRGHIRHGNIGEGASSSEWGRVAVRFFIASRNGTAKIVIRSASDSGVLGDVIRMSRMIVLRLQHGWWDMGSTLHVRSMVGWLVGWWIRRGIGCRRVIVPPSMPVCIGCTWHLPLWHSWPGESLNERMLLRWMDG